MKNKWSLAAVTLLLCACFLIFPGCALKDLLISGWPMPEEQEYHGEEAAAPDPGLGASYQTEEAGLPEAGEGLRDEGMPPAISGMAVTSGNSSGKDEELMDFPESCYAYSVLSERRKKIYVEIYRCLCDRSEEVLLSTKDPDEADLVFNAVMIDHPEIFYVSGYRITKTTLAGRITAIDFTGRYTMSDWEIAENRKKIEEYVNRFLEGVPDTEDEFEKVKYIFDYLVDHTEFKEGSDNNQNVCSVFVNGRSVCQGYSMAAKYLADEIGVFATVAYGFAHGNGHAWNIFRINGVYCHVDVTWGDSSYQNAYSGSAESFTDYAYLGADDDLIRTQHETAYFIRMPVCDSLEQYYFVKTGRYFEEPDRLKLMDLFREAYAGGEEILTIRCADFDVYDELSDDLFEEKEIFQYLKGDGKARYVRNREELTISFLLSV